MKESDKSIAQGDLWFRRIAAIPQGVTKKNPDAFGEFALAVSSSGSGDHKVSSQVAEFFTTTNPRLSYIVLTAEHADVVHHRPTNTHDTNRLLGGEGAVWEVRRPREVTPDGWRTVAD